jgi:hypothetical protein
MLIFNNLIDIGSDLDPTILLALNVLVIIHLLAFFGLMVVVIQNLRKTDQTIFIEQVKNLEKNLENKKKQ